MLGISRRHGITRLADLTGLDRIGFPVWQAVRPAGRSLSVHQGKGASALAAKIGALCEAIECDHAERAVADGPSCPAGALAPDERAPEIGDYCRDRSRSPAAEADIAWCAATDVVSGKAHYLPHDLVSLDLTRNLASAFERSSAGLGLGASEKEAIRTGLYEALERDAVGEWDRAPPRERLATLLAAETISVDWFRHWIERLRMLDMNVRIWAAASVIEIPCLIVSIDGRGEFDDSYRRFSGTAVDPDPEVALFKALAEALQTRLTFIAGVRDDILPRDYENAPARTSFPPYPGGVRITPWDELGPFPGDWETAVESLVGQGYRQIVVKRLDEGADGLAVVKVFVPGLGSLDRERRAPL